MGAKAPVDQMTDKKYDYEHHLMFVGFGPEVAQYPKWLHHDGTEPILVHDTAQEMAAREIGYDNITAAAMSNRNLNNWFWDLEDFSPKQLIVFAKDEFGVDLPPDAGQETLFKAVCKLTRYAPQNRNRLILMAHEIEMEYDATLAEIERLAAGQGQGIEREVITEEFWA